MSWAEAKYQTSPSAAGALAAITPDLLDVNAARLTGSPAPKISHSTRDIIVTTDSFSFDASTDYYKLQSLGRVWKISDAMLAMALAGFPGVEFHSIRNASDPQIPNPTGNIETANKQAGQMFSKYGPFTAAGSAIATWAVLSAKFAA